MNDMGTPTDKALTVRCPQCGHLTAYSTSNPWRPFCSERCKSMDFGAWASESYRVPTPPDPSDFDDLDDLAAGEGQNLRH